MNKLKFSFYMLLGVLAIAIASSCNSDNTETEPIVLSSSVSVTGFSLSQNSSLLSNLDSVFFTIDLQARRIYNADSLPVGTDVSKLVLNITLPTVSAAKLHISGGKVMTDTVVDYGTNPTDSIDCTGNVVLSITSQNELYTADYKIDVNVHNVESDSLFWNRTSRRDLPSRTTPDDQKTVLYQGKAVSLIHDTQGYMLATIDNPAESNWNRTELNLGFTPVVNTLTATSSALYLLSTDDQLYSSVDGTTWTSCNAKFSWLYGGYGEHLLGVEQVSGDYVVKAFPEDGTYTATALPDGMPIAGTSSMIEITSKWSSTSQVLMLGGVDRNGSAVGSVWGFDGKNWGEVTAKGIPAVEAPSMVAFFNHEVSTSWEVTQYPVLLAFGGIVDGVPSKTMYISYDNGVNWKAADDLLQLPEYIPAASHMQALVFESTLTDARSSDCWTAFPSRKLPQWWSLKSNDARSSSTWQCPYIYIFGGKAKNGTLFNNIWRGTINRLSFTPIK